MNASQTQVNGATPRWMPLVGDWRPIQAPGKVALVPARRPAPAEPTPAADPAAEEPVVAVPTVDPVAEAEAEAIRARAVAEADALRIEAEGRAEAEKVKAVEEARKQKLLNDKAEQRAREEQAAREARIAEHNRKRAAAERAEREEAEQVERDKQAERESRQKIEQAEDSWRRFAVAFAVVCGVVALPVQMAAFYNPHAKWLLAAPFMLEGGAWVVLRGAAAAVAGKRPHWHFRLIAWFLAFVAAGINLWHGLNAFDPATALGTAFASLAGPAIWDLHEHGRIRKRDGIPSRRERRERRKAEKRAAAEKAAEERQQAAENEAAAMAAAEASKQLAESRKKHFLKVWEHAEKLAADLGEVDVNAVWERAKLDVDGAKPGESAEVFRMRNVAAIRVQAARQNATVNAVAKGSSSQVASQMPQAKKPRIYAPPARRGVRRSGDTEPYVKGARTQASIAAKKSAVKRS